MNISTGIYEQIINRLFQLKLEQVDAERFYIGKKPITKEEAIRILSKYLLVEYDNIKLTEDNELRIASFFVTSLR